MGDIAATSPPQSRGRGEEGSPFQGSGSRRKGRGVGFRGSRPWLLSVAPFGARKVHIAKVPGDRASLQAQIDATDREIDRLVYDLYGLTEEEIAIVEQGTGS
jgi:hypothetical protein